MTYSVSRIRKDFPLLDRPFHEKPLYYLDSAVSGQMPTSVIERMRQYEMYEHTNVHRGVSTLSQEATDHFEMARTTVAQFLNASSAKEIIWTRGTTEAINLVAQTWGRQNIKQGDAICLTEMEHHANIVPWQMLAQSVGAHLNIIPVDDQGELRLDELSKVLSPQTKILALTHVSNVLGTINPIKKIITAAKQQIPSLTVLVDGAQAVAHLPVDVRDLGADFYTFSGHKLSGPTGIGILYGRKALLDAMPPWHGGGNMILSVTWDKTTYIEAPGKFEAGTPPIAAAIGLGEAIRYLSKLDLQDVHTHEQHLLRRASEGLKKIPGLRILGESADKVSVISFVVDGVHPHDLGTLLDHEGIVIRAGHHCAQPLMDRFQVPATTRASLAYYNNESDVDALIQATQKSVEMFHG
ncbi:MAG: aminotransferase class V-fold PLP-dependent enzyme [Holophagaceae bacterium]|jgi:cysteine desulfurase/selenocysteine lyase